LTVKPALIFVNRWRGPIRSIGGRIGGAIAAHPVAARWVLAGPTALLASLATMMAMPLWLPAGAAGVSDIVLPIVLTPLLWAAPFFYACLEPNLERCALVPLVPTLAQGLLVAAAMG
jgi:hypothetical protein